MERNLEFLNPEFLWLLCLLPVIAFWFYYTRKKNSASLKISGTKGFGKPSLLSKLKPMLNILRLLAIASLFIALARPRSVEVSKK